LTIAGLLVLTVTSVSFGKYSGGTGEPNDPYRIATPNDLNDIGNHVEDFNKCFVMVNDINLADYSGAQFNIIGNDSNAFTGVFDGNGHTISNFTYESNGVDYIGVFGLVAGSWCESSAVNIKDLRLIDPNIKAGTGDYVGALVGMFYCGSASGCYVEGGRVSGEVQVGGLLGATGSAGYRPWPGGVLTKCYASCGVSGNSSVGGLAGGNYGGIVASSCSQGSVEGDNEVGGLVGSNLNFDYSVESIIFDSYSTGSVTGTSCVGGLVGRNSWGASITRCYSAGSVTGTTDTGGLVGECSEPNDSVIGSFWDIQASGEPNSAGGTGRTTADMQDPNTFIDAGWDFVDGNDGPHDIWAEPNGGGYPILWWEQSPLPPLPEFSNGSGKSGDPYLVSTAGQLNSIGYNPRLMGSEFKLIDDVNLAGVSFFIIGSEMYPFVGTFDGNGHEVSNFTHNSTGMDNIGLFGVVKGESGTVKDLGLVDPNVDGGAEGTRVGSLVGLNFGGTVTGCYAEGGRVAGDSDVGGLVGGTEFYGRCLPGGKITYCYATCNVWGYIQSGGLVGDNSNETTVSQCFASGDVWGGFSAGGLAGNNTGHVQYCHATGSVTGDVVWAGGLVGTNHGTIHDSYASGSVTGDDCVGGLIGTEFEQTINCYSVGAVTGNSRYGGLVGSITSYKPTPPVHSYWDKETSNQSGSPGGGIGKTTAQMQTESTFTSTSPGWDFVGEIVNGPNDVWTIHETVDYPKHVWKLVNFIGWYEVNFLDYAFFADRWADTNCGNADDCDGTDLDFSDSVDWADLKIFCDHWLERRP
jgi:hypothetical protein